MANPNTAKYPSQLVTDNDLPVATGGFSTTLTSDIDSSTSTLPVNSTAANVPVILRIDNELILAVTTSGSNFTGCIRGFGGSTAAAHVSGTQVFGYISAYHFNQLAAEVKAIENALGANLSNVPTDLNPNPAGTYGDSSNYPILTVDSKGRVTSATNQSNAPANLNPSPAGTYGDSSNYPVITVDAKGRVTSATNQSNAPADLNPNPAGTYGNALNYPVITVDSKGRVTSATNQTINITNLDLPQYFYYRAAVAQGTVASLAFSMKSTGQPTASVVDYTNHILAVADFASGSGQNIWEHFSIPDDFKTNSSIEVKIEWFSNDTTGNVQWVINATAVAETESLNVSGWTWSQTVTENVLGTANSLNYSVINIDTTGYTIAGKEFVFNLSRGTDTAASVARLFAVRFKLIRTV
jgi:hypothetical protein